MAGRDPVEDPSLDRFVGDLPWGPVADGTGGVFGYLTDQGDQLAPLLGGNPGGGTGALPVGKPSVDGQIDERSGLESHPASTPVANHIDGSGEFTGNLGV